MNCISSKIINQKLIVNGVQSILKDRRILHSSFRYNHVFTYKLNRKPISNRNFRLNSVTLVRLASTNVYQQNSILDTESFDSLKDIGVNVSQSSFNSDELLSNFSSDVISKVAEPSFTSLGLGNGTPSGLIQLGLEYMHLEFGIPWWGTIVATTAIVRLLMVPFAMNSKKHHMAIQKLMPEIEAFKTKISEARLTGNPYEARLYEQQMQNLFKDNNIQIFKPMLPALVQGFFFLSFFWALHPMAALPIESLRNGGILWFTDLTAADPYYIMPVFCGGTVGYLLTYANDAFKMTQIYSLYLKAILYLIPLGVIGVTASFPSIILLYWSTNNVLSVAQFLVFRSEAFKKYFDAPMALPKTKQKRPV